MKEEMRLQKLMAMCGVASRRACEKLILEGKVTVNGKVVTELGTKASLDDEIKVDGQMIVKEDKVYYALYKPTGYLTTVKDELGRRTVMDLMTTEAKKNRIFPIGRLDYDTSGILLLTNDGELANALLHPSNNINKVYIATIEGKLSDEERLKLENGVIIDGKKTSPCEATVTKVNKEKNKTIVKLTIHEGRNHQVKNMFEAIDKKVLKLHREEFAGISSKGLYEGQHRKLTFNEVKALKDLAFKRKSND